MKTISRIGIIIFGCLFLAIGAGCMNYEEMYKKNGNDAIKYISEKYELEFHPLSYDLSDYLSETDVVECYTDGMDPNEEHASVFIKSKDSNGPFHDNYFEFIVRDDIENHLIEIMNGKVGESKAYKSNNEYPLPDELKNGSTINDLYDMLPDYEIWISVFIKNSPNLSKEEYKKRVRKIGETLSKEDRVYMIQVYVVDEEVYDSIDRYSRDDLMTECLKDGNVDDENIYQIYDASIDHGEVKEYE